MKKFNMDIVINISLILSKIAEVLHWIGVVSMSVLLICSLTAKNWLLSILENSIAEIGSTVSTYGFEISIVNAQGNVTMTAITLFCISSIIIFSLYAMVFRNAYLIIKTSKGKTWFSKGDTPFQSDIVRMLREIGIFLISSSAVSYIMGVIGRIIIGADIAEIGIRFESIVIGLLVLCLSQFFAYGTELQKDVDGLL